MSRDTGLPKRKNPRLSGFDYSSGVFFVTVCTQNRKRLLSHITVVGEGLAPPVDTQSYSDDVRVLLSPCGKVAEEQLLALETRFEGVRITDYVIMPEHIHAIIVLPNKTGDSPFAGGASPSPTMGDPTASEDASSSCTRELDKVICAFKSLTSRLCKQRYGIERIFQRSYFEHVVRNNDDYRMCRNYILDNPRKRYLQELNQNSDE